MNSDLNIILMCYELNKKTQRGIYQFSKSLIEALSGQNLNLGLFTQAYDKNDQDEILNEIYKSLEDPRKYFLKDNISLKIISSYLGGSLGLKNFKKIIEKNKLTDFDFYINKPTFYYDTNVDLLFNRIIYEKDISIPSMGSQDVIFTTAPLTIKSSHHKVIQTVHDIIPLETVSHYSKYFKRRISSSIHANKILCVSEYTRQQYLSYFPDMEERTKVVYQPLPANNKVIDLSLMADIQKQILDKYNLKSKQYMYYVGAIEERKNIHNLIKAYTIATNSDKSCPLVISGSVDGGYSRNYNLNEYLVSYTDFDKVSHNIMKTDFVSDIEKLVLLRNSRAFLFPSLSEGFGIPVIEAQTLGVPVMTSNNTSLPEVTNGSALLLENPLDIDEMVEGIKNLWSDNHYCSSLILLGNYNSLRFTKEKFKDAIGQFLEKV
ncbi:glycosyltransferase family 1 protein [Acinetobacter johnsonii]|uniref:glycosyltransferase family 4 protein n=1 Tax=Acinetobacter johnsonii TaxID=40214 RepID=UPI003D16C7F4